MSKLKDFKKRYGITQVNEHLRLTAKEYELIPLPAVSSYDEAIALLKRLNLRPATLDDLMDWYGWDETNQVVISGSVTEFDGRKFATALCSYEYCEPKERSVFAMGFTAECFKVKRLAMLDIAIPWNHAGHLLGVREI